MFKIAHRGYSECYKDNSLEAFEQAVKHGFTMIEMDIQLDKNKELIVFHDLYVKDKWVKDMTFDELRKIHPQILSLEQFFTQFDYQSIELYFDLKGDEDVVPYLLKYIQKYNINTSKIWFASFNIKHMDLLHRDSSFHKLGFITSNTFSHEMLDELINKYHLKFVCFDWNVFDQQCVDFIRSRDILVFYYTVTSPSVLNLTSGYKTDGIVSNIKLP
jgi:glycerophosphoryl diester phosphodiesterase